MTRQCSRIADLRDTLRFPSLAFVRGRLAFAAVSLAIILAAAWAFYAPALARTGGIWPAPLDDVYIHFDFARSAARGHPFSWIVGNGYSSGGTSLTYPLVLALGWAVGFRGLTLGIFAALVAVGSLVDAAFSLRRVSIASPIAFSAPVLLVAVPLLDWTLFSGMEVAFATALLLRALAAAFAASSVDVAKRPAHQTRAGLYLAALSLTRPECVGFALPLAVAVAHASATLSAPKSLARGLGPTVLVLALQAVVNRALTGESAAAGAVRKLITENPYASPADMVVAFLGNVARLRVEGIDLAFGGRYASLFVIGLGFVGMADRRLRRFSIALLAGAISAFALVCLNNTAPFQNLRYVAPTLVMLLSAAFLGVFVLGRVPRVGGLLACAAVAGVVALAAPAWRRQIDHFGRASRNIVEQQVEVGRRLRALPERPRRVFVGDAGAIPYVSDIPAVDGLGLGGYRGLPFARASVAGGPAVIELIERLAPSERPDFLAVYDSWWPDLVPTFGERLFDVSIEDNVICGDKKKSVYRADWSLLEDRTDPSALDRLDIGDLVDEREHRVVLPTPHAGYVIGAVLEGANGKKHFDAGRILAEGQSLIFVVRGSFPRGRHDLVIVTDGDHPGEVELTVTNGTEPTKLSTAAIPGSPAAAWVEIPLAVEDLGPGATVRVRPTSGALRAFSVLVR